MQEGYFSVAQSVGRYGKPGTGGAFFHCGEDDGSVSSHVLCSVSDVLFMDRFLREFELPLFEPPRRLPVLGKCLLSSPHILSFLVMLEV